jgi:hypothetical protein
MPVSAVDEGSYANFIHKTLDMKLDMLIEYHFASHQRHILWLFCQ